MNRSFLLAALTLAVVSTVMATPLVYACNLVAATVQVGMYPEGVAVNENTNLIYVANGGSNTVSVISAATNTVMATIPVPVGICGAGIGVNTKTNLIYVAHSCNEVNTGVIV